MNPAGLVAREFPCTNVSCFSRAIERIAGEKTGNGDERRMKRYKIIAVLLVMLLATMAMVPMVSAAENEKTTSAIDESKFLLPQLQVDNSLADGEVNAALSPMEGNNVYTIPTGSIIHHSKGYITRVFDSSGKQVLSANDEKSAKVFTPQGPEPATYVHTVPSGSLILDSPMKKNTTYIMNEMGELTLTVIDDSDYKIESTSAAAKITGPFWIEWAEEDWVSRVDKFESTWGVPTAPTSQDFGEKLAIFNGIRPQDLSLIIQPVLEWNVNNNNYAWTAASWRFGPSDSYTSSRINVNQYDSMRGTMEYMTIGGQTGWKVTTADTSTGSSTYLFTNRLSTDENLNLVNTLEAASGSGINEMADVCGSIVFNNAFTRSDGITPSVTLAGSINSAITSTWPGYFHVIINPNPTHVTLDTPY
jgi:hypothetical protein